MKTDASVKPSEPAEPLEVLLTEMDPVWPGARTLADTAVARLVELALLSAPGLSRDTVRVRVEGGWVTLSGEVEWQYQKQAAARAVADVAGMTGLSDQVGVRPKVSERDVRSGIEAALTLRARSDARALTVEIQGRDVTLSGIVHSSYERDAAWHSAWGSPGVRNVVDRLTVAS
ncbi:BON domain-containing protein [Rhodoferax sp.]|uniref:BON domain-containing protein n=1 Tax=Rhodoferax sp. TaxID=50421 RepID=UPI00275CD128|nr:BON domain-containing protein [Rhodoferax sp.]